MSPWRAKLWLLSMSLLCLLGCSRRRAAKVKLADAASSTVTQPERVIASVEQRPPRTPSELRWLAFGGGSDPLSNQISIAQDLTLASRLLKGPGLTLFASGKGALVAVTETQQGEPDLPITVRARAELTRILGPAGASALRYEPTTLAVDAPATRDHVLDVLRGALRVGDEPLLVIAASHGDHGATARENALALWGGWSLSVEDVAQLLDQTEQARPTRFVVTACYGGGFAELAFVGADPRRGERTPDHCGLFAAPWDDESSGCDPDPNRVKQESFTIHFLSALRGENRAGQDRKAQIDVDGDGKVSLLEAHAWARVHARSLDMPTTTSERYLREVAPTHETRASLPSEPEEQAVITALARELELPNETSARAKLRELERILDDASKQLDDAQQIADDSYFALRIALLERWPLLEHSWDPRAEALIERDAQAIVHLLTDSELAHANASAARELDDALAQHDAVRIARARVHRLVHGFETVRLAAALERRGGPLYDHYRALRSCERFTPALN